MGIFKKYVSVEVKKKKKSEKAVLLSPSQSTQLKELPLYGSIIKVRWDKILGDAFVK